QSRIDSGAATKSGNDSLDGVDVELNGGVQLVGRPSSKVKRIGVELCVQHERTIVHGHGCVQGCIGTKRMVTRKHRIQDVGSQKAGVQVELSRRDVHKAAGF